MAKTEKIFPLSTTGGRIQHLCIEKRISRRELYHAILREKATSNDDSSISRTVSNWYSEESKLNYEQIRRACDLLKCSSDYLLCMDECTNKTAQFIHDTTGLSEKAINILIEWQQISKNRLIFAGEYGLDFDEAEHYLQIVNAMFHDYISIPEESGETIFNEDNLFNLLYKYLFLPQIDSLSGNNNNNEKITIDCSKPVWQSISQNGITSSQPFNIEELQKRIALDSIDTHLKNLYDSLRKKKNNNC